jgi:hypothetical protein
MLDEGDFVADVAHRSGMQHPRCLERLANQLGASCYRFNPAG